MKSRFFLALLNKAMYKGKKLLKGETIAEMQRLQFSGTNKPVNIDLKRKNEGLFWRTKNNLTWLGMQVMTMV